MTFRIQTSIDWNVVTFSLSGQFNDDGVHELQRLLGGYGNDREFILDLKDVGLVDRDAVKFLARCKANGTQLKDCPEYIHEWIFRDEQS